MSPKQNKLPTVKISAIRKGSAKLGRSNNVSVSPESLDKSIRVTSSRTGTRQNSFIQEQRKINNSQRRVKDVQQEQMELA